MNAKEHLADQRIAGVQFGDPAEPGFHPRQLVGDDRGQESAHAVAAEPLAGAVEIRFRQAVLVEVHARVAVYLQVDVWERIGHFIVGQREPDE